MWARHRLEWVTAVVAAVLVGAYLLVPRMGTDLAAQVARAGFFTGHGWTPVDLRWYGGVDQLGYSLISPPVMAALGVRAAGALAVLLSAVALAVLLRRTGADRPWPAALLGVAVLLGDLVSGRVTYALGVLFGLSALLALTYRRLRWLAVLPALLAAATSPVAGLFLGLAGVALLVTGRVGSGLLIAVPAAVPVGVSAAFLGDGGWMNISHTDAQRAIVTSLVVAVLVPRGPVRAGGLLSAAGVLAAALVHTPVGLNATRLVVMFALPVLAGYARIPAPRLRRPSRQNQPTGQNQPTEQNRPAEQNQPAGQDRPERHRWLGRPMPWWALAVVLAAACWWQPPVAVGDVRDAGNATADPAYFAPLRAELAQQTLTGRVEIPPTRDYWEAASLRDIPLARGWLRQADIDRNPLFFTTVPGAAGTGVPLDAGTYRDWLVQQAVQFVALPDTAFSWPGRDEARLIRAGLPYLTPVWSDAHWRLYRVAAAQPIVPPPATMVGQSATAITFDTTTAGDVALRVHYYRWLRADHGAVLVPSGDWTLVRTPGPGRYTVTSGF